MGCGFLVEIDFYLEATVAQSPRDVLALLDQRFVSDHEQGTERRVHLHLSQHSVHEALLVHRESLVPVFKQRVEAVED